ncbi:MAG: TolC family protein [Armatimonas sp.]
MIPMVVWQAPQDATEKFTLEKAIAQALERSNTVKNAKRTVEADKKRIDEAGSAGKLNIGASASATRFDQATKISFTPDTPAITVLPEHSESLGITLAQRLDIFGQIKLATDQARLQSLADTFAADGTVRAKRLQAQQTYFGLLKARDQVKVAQSALDAANVQKKQAQTLFDEGVGQKVDLLRATTTQVQAEQSLEAAKNGEAVARAAFNDAVHIPLDTPVELEMVTEIPALPDEANVTKLAESRDDVLQAETLARAALVGVSIARAGDKPTLALQATGNYFPTTSLQSPRQRTAALGVSLSIPISDGGLTRARTDEARLRAENAQGTVGITRGNAALEAKQAYLNLRTARTQIETARTAAEQARAARDLAQVRYAGQVGLFLELSDAQNALVRAESAAIDALYEYHSARARLESATGTTKL